MIYQNKIIKFIKFKLTILRAYGVPKKLFFTKKDEEALVNYTDRTSKKVWKQIGENIKKDDVEGIVQAGCPFCLKHKGCRRCVYGKNHGVCEKEDGNHLSRVFKMIPHEYVITNKQYKFIWEKIDNE